ncbi:MAG: hypothetical protein HWD92_07870 [Flavobacteriia bacterium]|nr:hypothetical protein [Flavobacteriia bacterium]
MKTLWVAAAVCVQLSGYACDVCGCRVAYSNWQYSQNFTSSMQLGYQQVVFHSEHFADNVLDKDHYAEELFRILTLQGRYALSDRWMIQANIPFVLNTYRDIDVLNSTTALGDIQVSTFYRVIQSEERLKFNLDLGLGLKGPSGSWQDASGSLPASILPGTGSWDWSAFLAAGYMLNETSSVGLSAVAVLPGENDFARRFGRQYQLQSGYEQLIYTSLEKGWSVSGQVGYSYLKDEDDLQRYGSEQFTVANSGGEFHSAFFGFKWMTDVWSFGVQTSVPLHQSFAEGKVKAQPTAQFNIKYNFN